MQRGELSTPSKLRKFLSALEEVRWGELEKNHWDTSQVFSKAIPLGVKNIWMLFWLCSLLEALGKSVSKLLQVVGWIHVLAAVGQRSCFLADCHQGYFLLLGTSHKAFYIYLENQSHFNTENSPDLQLMCEPSNKGLLATLFYIYLNFTVSKEKNPGFPLCPDLMLTSYTQLCFVLSPSKCCFG